MKTQIEKLREIQNEEISNGFANGELYNNLEDIIWRLENPKSTNEAIQSDMYGGKTIEERNRAKK